MRLTHGHGSEFDHAFALPFGQRRLPVGLRIKDPKHLEAGRNPSVDSDMSQPLKPDDLRFGRLARIGQSGDQSPLDMRLIAFAQTHGLILARGEKVPAYSPADTLRRTHGFARK